MVASVQKGVWNVLVQEVSVARTQDNKALAVQLVERKKWRSQLRGTCIFAG